MNNKEVFLSGKLSGTKTLSSELDTISNPDEIEMFLRAFVKTKFNLTADNEIVYVNDDEDFVSKVENFEKLNAVSIYINETFSRMYVTTEEKMTYAVRLNKVSTDLIGSFISKEKPIKYTLNSFSFVKWCNTKSIDLRNIYDIPTYIKILTNDVDPFKSITEYIKEYSDGVLREEDNEYNCIIIGNFILSFGSYLAEFVEKFNLSSVNKVINENSYFEASTADNDGLCKIRLSYIDIEKYIEDVVDEINKKFEDRAYIISPVGRIAIKFGRKSENIIKELYNDDLQLMILNELYNSNIRVTLLEENLYQITCKYKNLAEIISISTAIFKDIFYTMFQNMIDIKLECIIKE